MSRRFLSLFAGAAAALFAGPASALDTHVFTATLTSSQEVPTNSSTGSGTCTVTLDDVSGAVSVSGSFSGLTSAATAAHIHGLAGPGVNAGIIVGLTETGGTSGAVSGGGILAAGDVTGMLSGLTYINVHTSTNPGGEIRGQIMAGVPAMPWHYALALAVLAVAGGAFVVARRPATVA